MGSGWEYQVRVEGRIGRRWLAWFDDLAISATDEEQAGQSPAITTLTGVMPDQAALAGLLQKLYSLGLPLLEVRRMEAGRVDRTSGEQGMRNPSNEMKMALPTDDEWRKGGYERDV